MKALILGSNGFIGSWLSLELGKLGYDVKKADINRMGDRRTITFDADNPDFFGLLRSVKPDICFNCTGAASVPNSFSDPAKDFELNAERVYQILNSIRLICPDTKFLNFSSAAIYGNPATSPVSESQLPNPVSPYGMHKLYSESICKEFFDFFGINTISLRVFSAYGPGLRKQLFWDVYHKGLSAGTIELFGTGRETRDFIFVSDICRAVDLVAQSAIFDGKSINVASGRSRTIKEVVELYLGALQWNRSLKFTGEERSGDPVCWQADISVLESMGFRASTTIADGIKEVAKWVQNL